MSNVAEAATKVAEVAGGNAWIAAMFPNNPQALLVIGAVVALLRLMWNSRVPMRKLKVEADQVMITNLLNRVSKLESDNERIHKDAEDKLKQITKDYEHKLASLIAGNEARAAVDEAREAVLRHELANTRTCFNALLLLLKRMPNPPAELAGIVADIETMRTEYNAGEELQRRALDNLKNSSRDVIPDGSS